MQQERERRIQSQEPPFTQQELKVAREIADKLAKADTMRILWEQVNPLVDLLAQKLDMRLSAEQLQNRRAHKKGLVPKGQNLITQRFQAIFLPTKATDYSGYGLAPALAELLLVNIMNETVTGPFTEALTFLARRQKKVDPRTENPQIWKYDVTLLRQIIHAYIYEALANSCDQRHISVQDQVTAPGRTFCFMLQRDIPNLAERLNHLPREARSLGMAQALLKLRSVHEIQARRGGGEVAKQHQQGVDQLERLMIYMSDIVGGDAFTKLGLKNFV